MSLNMTDSHHGAETLNLDTSERALRRVQVCRQADRLLKDEPYDTLVLVADLVAGLIAERLEDGEL